MTESEGSSEVSDGGPAPPVGEFTRAVHQFGTSDQQPAAGTPEGGLCLAPIALFAFRRPEHLRITLEALRQNAGASGTDLFIFIDKPGTPELEQVHRNVIEVARSATGFRSIRVTVRSAPLGLADNIVSGVTEVASKFGRVIVVEDDIVTSPHFLNYMNECLDTYVNDPHVASVHGWAFPTRLPLPETYFLRGADCWGWATWLDRWLDYESDGQKLLDRLIREGRSFAFDHYGAFPFTRLLRQQIQGVHDSWAIRWHATCFLRGRVTLFPARSLVTNIGFGGDGATHCGPSSDLHTELATHPPTIKLLRAAPTKYAVAVIWVHWMRRRIGRLFLRIGDRLSNVFRTKWGRRS